MGKHSIEKERHGKKFFLIIFILILIIAGITIYLIKNPRTENIEKNVDNNIEKSADKDVEDTINNTFYALKQGNLKEINKYINYQDLIGALDEDLTKLNNGNLSDVEKAFFDDMEWTIEKIDINDNKATAVVEMKNKDFKEIFSKWIQQRLDKSNKEKDPYDLLGEITKSAEIPSRSIIKKIQLNKEGENWRLLINEDMQNLVFPGIEIVEDIITNMN